MLRYYAFCSRIAFLLKHTEFLERLDNALRNVFIERYEALYERAMSFFNEFKQTTHAQVYIATKEVFLSLVMIAERTQPLPAVDDDKAVMKFVLPKIIADSTDFAVMSQITKWLMKE